MLDQIAPGGYPSGERSAAAEPLQIRRLRAYSNYLSPVHGFSIDLVTLIATFVRNLALHWLVLLPLIAAAVMLPYLYLRLTMLARASGNLPDLLRVGQAIAFILATFGFINTLRSLPSMAPMVSAKHDFIRWSLTPVLASVVLQGSVIPMIPSYFWPGGRLWPG